MGKSSTLIQWFADTKRRFFPLVNDEEWGARRGPRHQQGAGCCWAFKARDIADLIAIGFNYCPLGPLILAAAGKPPNFSPRRTIDEIRRHALSIPAEELMAVKGLPSEWSPEFIRDETVRFLEAADNYIMSAPPDLLGILVVDKRNVPVQLPEGRRDKVVLRKATDEPEVMPAPAEFNAVGWNSAHP